MQSKPYHLAEKLLTCAFLSGVFISLLFFPPHKAAAITFAELAPRGSVSNLKEYRDLNYGYRISYPTVLTESDPMPTNGDGRSFQSKDGHARLICWGAQLNEQKNIEALYRDDSEAHPKATYKVFHTTWYVISWEDDGTIYYKKLIVAPIMYVAFIFDYRSSDRTVYDPVVSAISKSFIRTTQTLAKSDSRSPQDTIPSQSDEQHRSSALATQLEDTFHGEVHFAVCGGGDGDLLVAASTWPSRISTPSWGILRSRPFLSSLYLKGMKYFEVHDSNGVDYSFVLLSSGGVGGRVPDSFTRCYEHSVNKLTRSNIFNLRGSVLEELDHFETCDGQIRPSLADLLYREITERVLADRALRSFGYKWTDTDRKNYSDFNREYDAFLASAAKIKSVRDPALWRLIVSRNYLTTGDRIKDQEIRGEVLTEIQSFRTAVEKTGYVAMGCH